MTPTRSELVGCSKSNDETLTTASRAARRRWAERVLRQLEGPFGRDLSPYAFEAHAGSAYLDVGLACGIEERGGRVERPLEGLGLGRRLAYYLAYYKEGGCL